MSFAIFEENFYSGCEQSTLPDPIPVLALILSGVTIYFSFKAIKVAKQTDIAHRKFQDLCLDPVKVELDRLLDKLNSSKDSPISTQITLINTSSRNFSMLLVRIRTIYDQIDVSLMQDRYQEFSDLCLSKPEDVLTEHMLDEFLILRVTILDHIYEQAMINVNRKKKWFRR